MSRKGNACTGKGPERPEQAGLRRVFKKEGPFPGGVCGGEAIVASGERVDRGGRNETFRGEDGNILRAPEEGRSGKRKALGVSQGPFSIMVGMRKLLLDPSAQYRDPCEPPGKKQERGRFGYGICFRRCVEAEGNVLIYRTSV